MARVAGSHAKETQNARAILLAHLTSLVLLLWGTLLPSPVRAQTTSCPPEPIFDAAGQLDETAYEERLEQCFREEQAQQLEAYLQARAQTPEIMGVAEAAVLEQDSLALVALYNSTDGPNWTRNTNWLSGPVSTWYGVTVSEGRVQSLQLSRNRLSGSIPPELANLSHLEVLNLDQNQLTGSIPPELGNLPRLVYLSLSYNKLSGSIPPELARLASLQDLMLNRNQLSGSIPRELGNLFNLQRLVLGGNQLSGSIPPELGNLTDLQYLNLADNQLSGSIPPWLGDLTGLVNLWLEANQLTGGIPPELGNLNNLAWLRLDDNQLIGGIPPELGNLSNLTELNLSMNRLEGDVPSELGNLTDLQHLNLAGNQLTGGVLWRLRYLSKLQYLDLGQNQFSGRIPAELGNFEELRGLDLSENEFSGEIPGELGRLPHLHLLDLASNQLVGSILTFSFSLNLQHLNLADNGLSGSIPRSLSYNLNLRFLSLAENELSGEIPWDFHELRQLEYLNLSGNDFSGSPVPVGNLSQLKELYLNDNEFSGTIPLEFVRLTQLSIFDFSVTNLCEPSDPSFQAWIRSIPDVRSTGIACGQLTIWVNPEGGSWHDPANWSPTVVPAAQDTVLIPDSLSPQGVSVEFTITLDEDVTVRSISTPPGSEGGPSYVGVGTVTFSSEAHTLSVLGDITATGQEYSDGLGWTLVFDCPVGTVGSARANEDIYSSILFKKSVQEIGEVTGPIVFEGPVDRVGAIRLIHGNISFQEDVREVEEVYIVPREGDLFRYTLSFGDVTWIGQISSPADVSIESSAPAEVSIGRVDSIGTIQLGPLSYITHYGLRNDPALWIGSVELTPSEPYGDGSTTFGIDLRERKVNIDTLYIGKNRHLKSGILTVQRETTLEPESVLDASGNVTLLGDATIGIFGPNLKSEEDTLRLQRAHYIENYGAPILNGVLVVDESLNTAAEIVATALIARTGASVKALGGHAEKLEIEAKAALDVEELYSSRALNDGSIRTRILRNRSLNPCAVTNNGLLEISALTDDQNYPDDFYEVSCDTVANQGVFSMSEGVDVDLQLFANAEGGLLRGEGIFTDSTLFVSAGGIVPGDSSTAGTIHFKDDFALQTTARLDVDLGGLEPGTAHDQLVVDGAAQLAGFLHVDLIQGHTPVLADSFRVLRLNGGYTGTFASVALPALPGSLALAPRYDARGLLIVVVPAQGGTPPLAANDTLTVTSTMPVLLDVLANDDPLDADSVKVVYVSHPSQQGGSVAISADSLGVIYQAPRGYVGPDTFSYTIRDNLQDTARASVLLTVGNTPPSAVDDQAETTLNTPVVIDVLANDDDVDGDSLFIAAVGAPAHGSAAVADGRVTYTPEDGYVGEDTFDYTVDDGRGGCATASVVVTVKQGTGVADEADVPTAFRLEQNYPNPFNPATTIRYALPEACAVRLVVFDALGREVTVLVSTFQAPGHHTVTWEAGQLPSGLYLYRLEAGSFAGTRLMLLLK